ncbi:hypothetical protein [Variovorax guangxiensis]|uniref:hypothetical protein n=1 Tax=Variovorax guangxiensis TaxID=1775474 RepID=UPI00112A9D8B|nr:hypothetical protein [Variovorax guangxiensis]
MDKPLTPARRALLRQLKSILGHSFFGPSIRNYGPGGGRLPDGRGFRYPLTLRRPDVEKRKVTGVIPAETSDELLHTGYYAVGAKQFEVISGLVINSD